MRLAKGLVYSVSWHPFCADPFRSRGGDPPCHKLYPGALLQRMVSEKITSVVEQKEIHCGSSFPPPPVPLRLVAAVTWCSEVLLPLEPFFITPAQSILPSAPLLSAGSTQDQGRGWPVKPPLRNKEVSDSLPFSHWLPRAVTVKGSVSLYPFPQGGHLLL